jgi:hypothetical protein
MIPLVFLQNVLSPSKVCFWFPSILRLVISFPSDEEFQLVPWAQSMPDDLLHFILRSFFGFKHSFLHSGAPTAMRFQLADVEDRVKMPSSWQLQLVAV